MQSPDLIITEISYLLHLLDLLLIIHFMTSLQSSPVCLPQPPTNNNDLMQFLWNILTFQP